MRRVSSCFGVCKARFIIPIIKSNRIPSAMQTTQSNPVYLAHCYLCTCGLSFGNKVCVVTQETLMCNSERVRTCTFRLGLALRVSVTQMVECMCTFRPGLAMRRVLSLR